MSNGIDPRDLLGALLGGRGTVLGPFTVGGEQRADADDDDCACGDAERYGRISTEGMLARLQDAAPRWIERAGRFKVGDIVTPVKDGMVRGHGYPCLVVAVDPDAKPQWNGKDGNPTNGMILDMRVIRLDHGCCVAYWSESAYYEPWTGEQRAEQQEGAP